MAKKATKKKPQPAEPVNFTKTRLAAIVEQHDGERCTVRDAKTRGLVADIRAGGTLTFYVQKRVSGRPSRIRIGRFPDETTVEQARRQAAEIIGEIAKGQDPAAAKRRKRGELTFGDLCDYWLEHAQQHKKTWREDKRKFDKHLADWQRRRLSDISKQTVQKMHSATGKRHGKYAANRLLEIVRAMFTKAIDDELFDGRNPAAGVKKFAEKSRDRYLLPEELPRWWQALNAYPDETLRDFFLLALLTGARRGNVQAMCWADVDLKAGVWRIPETKSGEPVLVHLSEAALSVLQARRKATNGCPWVFPSRSAIGHLQEPKRAWKTILKNADITDLRIHDLRRTLGSWQAITGSSLPVIGKSLGHKSQSATAVYARLGIEPVRESVDRATQAMLEAAGVSVTEDDEPPR